jgi:4-amino-4-deoxy-L-arabinose transferase-like glycosyltransferase
VWCVFVFAFFSVSQSKLSGYIVPVLPPLALLAGRYLCVVEAAALRRQLLPALAAPLALLAALLYITFLSPSGEDAARIASAAPYLVVAAALMAGAILYALLCVARATLAAVVVLSLANMAASQALLASADFISPQRTSWHIARQIGPHLRGSTRLYSVGIYPQSLPVYLGRTMTLVAFTGELDYGLHLEPHKGIPDLATFRDAWLQESDAIAVMSKATYAELASGGLPMKLIGEDAVRIAVRRL